MSADTGETGPATDRERRAAKDGLRHGKLGYEVTRSPYGAGDRSAAAVAWRRGWTLGNAAFRRATDGEAADGGCVVCGFDFAALGLTQCTVCRGAKRVAGTDDV